MGHTPIFIQEMIRVGFDSNQIQKNLNDQKIGGQKFNKDLINRDDNFIKESQKVLGRLIICSMEKIY